MKVLSSSALRTGPFYSPENIPGTHFCKRLSQPKGHSAAGRIMSMKNSNDTIGNRTRDLPACSAVPTDLTIMNSTFRPGTASSLWDRKNWVAQIFQKSRSYLKIPSATRVTWIKDHTEYPRIYWGNSPLYRIYIYFNLPDDGSQFKPKHAAKLLFILHQTKQVGFDWYNILSTSYSAYRMGCLKPSVSGFITFRWF
jgi:hypothetical protein